MALRVVCPKCHRPLTVPDTLGGKNVRCTNCQTVLSVQVAPTAPQVPSKSNSPAEVPKQKSTSATPATPAAPSPANKIEGPPAPVQSGAIHAGKSASDPTRPLDNKPAAAKRLAKPTTAVAGIKAKPARGGGRMLLLGGAGCAALFALVALGGCAIGIMLFYRGSPKTNNLARQPGQLESTVPSTTPVTTDSPSAKLTRESKERVKQATVFLRVTMANGKQVSGSGFFGCPDDPKLVLTNAHVVGMLTPESVRPKQIEVVINSGQEDLEDETQAQVLGVDRSTDLAVLELAVPTKKQRALPAPLMAKSAEKLTELDELYVFGFPLGDRLGKEITVRPSSVSALRKLAGTNLLDKIQVNGGMDPGNSGGPVVDNTGGVVGVAVSGIQGRMINFAIPGERVNALLRGRVASLDTGQPFVAENSSIGVPVIVDLIDPRNQIKEVVVEAWVGDPGKPRPSAKQTPAPAAGDSPRARFRLDTADGSRRKGELVLPPLPDGKVYWTQAFCTNGGGETQWAVGSVYKPDSPPVERKSADLVFQPKTGIRRDMTLTRDMNFRLSESDDALVARARVKVVFDTLVDSVTVRGALITLDYKNVERTTFVKSGDTGKAEDFKPVPSALMTRVGDHYRGMRVLQTFDTTGSATGAQLDAGSLQGKPAQDSLRALHGDVEGALKLNAVPLPNQKSVAANTTWKASRNIPVQLDGKDVFATFNLTYTYLGRRRQENRDEAVIEFHGVLDNVNGKKENITVTFSGAAVVDLATGEIASARSRLALEEEIKLPAPEGSLAIGVKGRIDSESRVEYSQPK
jgi:LSD1 subclass zinc finger protein